MIKIFFLFLNIVFGWIIFYFIVFMIENVFLFLFYLFNGSEFDNFF